VLYARQVNLCESKNRLVGCATKLVNTLESCCRLIYFNVTVNVGRSMLMIKHNLSIFVLMKASD
jgi:hypothetical protein